VLRQLARPLIHAEIVSPDIQRLIQDMRETMQDAPGVGLAAPQVGLSIQLAIVEDRPQSVGDLTPEQLTERERTAVPFQVIINPTITYASEERAEFFEGCLSVEGFAAIVPRSRTVRVEFLNEKSEPCTLEASGWHARILQHEIDICRAISTLIECGRDLSLRWTTSRDIGKAFPPARFSPD